MHEKPKPSAVIFAKDVTRLAHFYQIVTEMQEVDRDQGHVVLDEDHFQLVIHGMPARIAAAIIIAEPPEIREETPIKICLPVASIAQARDRAAQLGGRIGAKGQQWQARGLIACDGYDPEGNVFHLREADRTARSLPA